MRMILLGISLCLLTLYVLYANAVEAIKEQFLVDNPAYAQLFVDNPTL